MNLRLYVTRFSNHLRDYLNHIAIVLNLRSDIGPISSYRRSALLDLCWEPLLQNLGLKPFFSQEILSDATATISFLCILEIPVIKTYLIHEKPMDINKPETILW